MSSSAASTGVDALATLKAQERILNQTLLMLENQKERLIVEETDLLHYLEKQQQKEDAAHRSQHPLQVVNQTTNEQAHVACGSDTLVAVTSASNELNLNPMIGIAAPGTFNVKNQNVEEEDDDDDDEDE